MKVDLNHWWFKTFSEPSHVPCLQQSVEFITAMRAEIIAARKLVAVVRKFRDLRDADRIPYLFEALDNYDESVK